MSSWISRRSDSAITKRKHHLELLQQKMCPTPVPCLEFDNPNNTEYITTGQHAKLSTTIRNNNEGVSCLEYIDAILYINLEHRTDRNEHCTNEIKKIDPTLSKTHRIDAVYCKENGALGCSLSHIKALELILKNPSWKTVMILEDDFTFITDHSPFLHSAIIHLLRSISYYDMLLLGIGVERCTTLPTQQPTILRLTSAQTTSGYIIPRHYVYTLLSNYTQSSYNMIQFGWKSEWCLDQHWKQIMPISNWYTLHKKIAYQYGNYSDIEGKFTSYNC